MQNDLLLLATMFVTRVALPVLITLIVGSLLERALHRDSHPVS